MIVIKINQFFLSAHKLVKVIDDNFNFSQDTLFNCFSRLLYYFWTSVTKSIK